MPENFQQWTIFSFKIQRVNVRQTFLRDIDIRPPLVFPEVYNEFKRKTVQQTSISGTKNAHKVGHFATKCGLWLRIGHEAGLPDCPLIDHVRPILGIARRWIAVLGLVVVTARTLLFVRKALLDPVVWQPASCRSRAGCAPQVVRSELAKRLPFLLGQTIGQREHLIERWRCSSASPSR